MSQGTQSGGGMQMWLSGREGVPELICPRATLRELQMSDAASLVPLLRAPEVRRFLLHEPGDLDAFESFIEWTHRERRSGRHLCYGIVPKGSNGAVGLIQVWPIEPTGRTVEWGFALGRPFWGHGLFHESASALVDFVTGTLGVSRLEARAAVSNIRGNAALRRLGAVREGVLRQCFSVDDAPADYVMWSILAADWSAARTLRAAPPLREPQPALRVS